MKEYLDRTMDIGPYVPEPDDDLIICRCEEITRGEIRKAIHEGMFTMTEVKRYLTYSCKKPLTPLLSVEPLYVIVHGLTGEFHLI